MGMGNDALVRGVIRSDGPLEGLAVPFAGPSRVWTEHLAVLPAEDVGFSYASVCIRCGNHSSTSCYLNANSKMVTSRPI